VIVTEGEGEEGEKDNLKICLASSVKGKSADHYTKEDCKILIEIFHCKYYAAVFFQFSPLKGP
jgi:hypothetical protein